MSQTISYTCGIISGLSSLKYVVSVEVVIPSDVAHRVALITILLTLFLRSPFSLLS